MGRAYSHSAEPDMAPYVALRRMSHLHSADSDMAPHVARQSSARILAPGSHGGPAPPMLGSFKAWMSESGRAR